MYELSKVLRVTLTFEILVFIFYYIEKFAGEKSDLCSPSPLHVYSGAAATRGALEISDCTKLLNIWHEAV